jgi:hypothetical protein
MKTPQALLAGWIVFGLALPAAAGVTVGVSGENKEDQALIYIEGNKMRVEGNKSENRKESLMIYDGDAQKMMIVDPDKKTYSEITPQALHSFSDRMQKQMEEAKAKMTPEQRKQLDEMMNKMPPEQRQMMGKPADPPPAKPKEQLKWERTGTTQTVAGYTCEGYREIKDGKVDAEGCYLPWSAGAITKADMAPFKKMEQFVEQSGMKSPDRRLTTFARLEEAPGFPVVWKPADSEGKPKQTVTSIKRGTVASDKFQVPAGYTKTDAFGGTK